MPARILDTDAAFTRRSPVIGQEKTCGCVGLVRISRVIVFNLRLLLILNLKQKFANFWAIFGTRYLTITIVNFHKFRTMPI